nr:hypothetical protein CFP56_28337 [Quercus suber]
MTPGVTLEREWVTLLSSGFAGSGGLGGPHLQLRRGMGLGFHQTIGSPSSLFKKTWALRDGIPIVRKVGIAKLLVDVVAIKIDGLDHPMAIFDEAFHAQAVDDEVELRGGDEAVLILIVELERIAELERQKVANSIREMKPSWSESAFELVVLGMLGFDLGVEGGCCHGCLGSEKLWELFVFRES